MFITFNKKKHICNSEIIKLVRCIDNNIEKCLLKDNKKNSKCIKYLNLLKKCENDN